VKKTRSTYSYRDTEIALDHIASLWWFIEIENIGRFETIDEATTHVFAVAAEMNVEKNQQDKRWYPYLLMEKAWLL
jgi:adenylate cyclase class IV